MCVPNYLRGGKQAHDDAIQMIDLLDFGLDGSKLSAVTCFAVVISAIRERIFHG